LGRSLAFPALRYVLDRFHAGGHTDPWCIANVYPLLPENAAAIKILTHRRARSFSIGWLATSTYFLRWAGGQGTSTRKKLFSSATTRRSRVGRRRLCHRFRRRGLRRRPPPLPRLLPPPRAACEPRQSGRRACRASERLGPRGSYRWWTQPLLVRGVAVRAIAPRPTPARRGARAAACLVQVTERSWCLLCSECPRW